MKPPPLKRHDQIIFTGPPITAKRSSFENAYLSSELNLKSKKMKNLLLATFVLLSFTLYGQEEPDYVMFSNTYITPKYDKIGEFAAALSAHNKTYHSEGPFRATVFFVNAGPNSGKVVNSSGPHTFADMDTRENQPGHGQDWMENVMPHIAKIEDGGYWRRQNSLSYSPDDASYTKWRIVFVDVVGGEGYRFNELMRKLAAATESGHPENARVVYNRRGFHDDGKDRAIAHGLKHWADLDNSIADEYEAVHGEGSWDILLEEVTDVIGTMVEEHWEVSPYMSGYSIEEEEE